MIALSSGEAELAGIVKGVGEGLGLRSLGQDLDHDMRVGVYSYIAAPIGICCRSGIGRARHLVVGQLGAGEVARGVVF